MTTEARRYSIVRRLAVGGMSEVFEARSPTGRELVLKRMLPRLARDPENVRAFLHEGELGARLTSLEAPNLVATLDHGTDAEGPFIALELVRGAPLSDLVRRGRDGDDDARPPLEVALFVVGEVLAALGALHDAEGEDGGPLGIVHRDVNPANLLVGPDGAVKLADLGIARSRMREGRTRTGVIKGKLDYLAPEQVTGSTVDARADLYAVGVLLFELATGEPYLEAADDVALLRMAEAPELRLPSAHGGDARLDPIVRRALARFPEERFRSARLFRDALRALETAEGGAVARAWLGARASAEFTRAHGVAPERADTDVAPRADVAPPAPAAAAALRRGPRAWPLLAGAAALVAGVSGVVWSLRPAPPPADTALRPASSGSIDAPPTPSAPAESSAAESVAPESSETAAPPLPSSSARPPVAPARPSGTSASSAPAAADPELDALRAKLGGARAKLAKKGLSPSDLAPADQAALARADAALARGDAAAARADVDAFEAAADAAAVDAAFVRAQLDRVSAKIREAKARGVDTTQAEARAAAALQSFLDRRYEATNAELDAILASLP